jgi:hypothetical protein
MNASQHAEQILAAWKRADTERFGQELDKAMSSCQRAKPANHLESEQREVLESVVARLQLIHPQRRGLDAAEPTPQGIHAGFTLLEHLKQRVAA